MARPSTARSSRSLRELKASDLLQRDVITLAADARLATALSTMRKHRIHQVPILDNQRYIGILSYDSLVQRRHLPLNSHVAHIPIHTVSIDGDAALPEVAHAMVEQHLEAVPVVSKRGALQGIVARIDLIRALQQAEEVEGLTLADIATSPFDSVPSTTPIETALHALRTSRDRGLAVVDGRGRLVGQVDVAMIIDASSTDDRRGALAVDQVSRPDVHVTDVMKGDPPTASPSAPLVEVLELLGSTDSPAVYLVDESGPQGMVTQWDIMRYAAQFVPKRGVQVEVSGLHTDDLGLYGEIDTAIAHFLRRLKGTTTPVHIHLHVTEHTKHGRAVRYGLSLQVETTHGSYHLQGEDWDIVGALSELLDKIERQAAKGAAKRKDKR